MTSGEEAPTLHVEPASERATHPVCSVCIANYNGEHMLRDCLDSVFSQDWPGQVEVIVHDDASTDGSLAVIRAYPRVELLRSERNAGFCASNNRMVAHARGEFVLLLNNDAALFPDALSTLMSLARRHPQGAVLTLPQYDWTSGQLVDRGCLLDPFYNPVPNLDPGRDRIAMAIGACLWIGREHWRLLGGLPEWLGSIAEDMYLCCAARQRGLPVLSAPASGYRHRQGASFGGNKPRAGKLATSFRRRALSETNKTRILYVFSPSPFLLPLLCAHTALLAAEGLALSLLKRDFRLWAEIYWPALCVVPRTRGFLRAVRDRAQGARVLSSSGFFSVFVPWPRKLALLKRYGVPEIR